MKKIFAFFLSCTLLISAFTFPVQVDAEEKNEEYSGVIRENIIDDTELEYNGNWDSAEGTSEEPEKSEHWNVYPLGDNDSYSFTFKGNQFILYGKKAPNHGSFSVEIDGVKVEDRVSQKSESAVKNQILYESDLLECKEHTIKITNVKEEDQSKRAIQIEYVKIFRELEQEDCYKEVNVESNDITTNKEENKIHYSEGHNWAEGTGSAENYSGGNDYWTGTKGAYYEISFKGKSIKIYGKRAADFGQYDVYMDGEKIATIDARSDEVQLRQILFEMEFDTVEEHEFKVIKEGSGVIEIDNIIIGTDEYIPVEQIQVYPEVVELGIGQNQDLFTNILPDNSTTDTVQYRSLNSKIAEVNTAGNVKGISAGETEVEIICGGKTIKVPVKVQEEKKIMGVSFAYTGTHTLNQDYQKNKLLNDKSESLVLWKNDEAYAKAVIWSYDKALNNVRVTSSDLEGDAGTIESECVSVNFLTEVSAYVGKGNAANKPHEQIPDVIDYKESINISPESLAGVWITVQTDNDAKPGVYNGILTISSDETVQELSYTVEVLDITYPETKDYTMLELWQYPFSAARYYNTVGKENYFSEQHIKVLKQQLQLYADAGGTAITTSILEEPWGHQTYDDYPSMVKWIKTEDGSYAFDYSWFDSYVELCMDLGIDKQIKSFSMVPWSNKITFFDQKNNKNDTVNIFKTENGTWTGEMTAEGEEAWNAFLESYIKHLDEKGWFDITYIAMDERPMESMKTAIELVHEHKNKEGKTLKISGCFNHYGTGNYEEILENTDDVSIGMTAINGKEGADKFREWALDRREKGLLTSIYTCTTHYPNSFIRSNPDEAEWVLWFVQSMNADDFLRWAYDSFVGDPYVNLDSSYYEAGDEFFIYPDPNKDSTDPIARSSVRFEMTKKGIRNIVKYRYLLEHAEESVVEKLEASVFNVQRINGTTVEGGAEGTEESKQLVTSQVKELESVLLLCTREYIGDRNADFEETVSFKTLEKVLAEAKEIVESGAIDDSFDAVKELFDTAIKEAEAVIAKGEDAATKTEVQNATWKLYMAIWASDWNAPDKSDLKEAIDLADMVDLTKYVEAGKDEFTAALKNAKEVYEDGNAFEDDVQSAWEALVEATANLRFKADKATLEDLLNSLADLDLSKYTDGTVAAYNAALTSAKAVMKDDTLSVDDQQVVDDAAAQLQAAYDALALKDDTTGGDPDDNPGTTDSDNSKPGTGDAGQPNQNNADKTTDTGSTGAVKTGDSSSSAFWVILVIAAAGAVTGVTVIRRKKSGR